MTDTLNLQPLDDRIIVEPDEVTETQTESGLIVPQVAQEKSDTGTVLAISDGMRDEHGNYWPHEVAPGDRVIYLKYGGTQTKHEGRTVLILNQRDVLAKILQ